MPQGATLYPGVPTAGVFSNTITDSSPLTLDITTGNLYYYKSGTGVVQVVGIPLAGPVNLPGPVTVTGTLLVTSTSQFNGQITSAVLGVAPFVVSSNVLVTNLNANFLQGFTWAIPGAIGSTTPNSAVFTNITASRNSVSPTAIISNPGSGTGLSVSSGTGAAISASSGADAVYATVTAASTGAAIRGVSSSANNTGVFADGSAGGIGLGMLGVINNFNTTFTAATGVVATLTFLNNKPGAATNGEWMEVYNGARRGWIPWWPH